MTPMVLWLLQAGEEGARGFDSPFQVNFGIIFWTWVVFGLLFFALWRFAWPAILKATEEREQKIKHQLAEAERLNTEAKAALEEHKTLLAGARQEATTLLAEARAVSEREREQALAKTRAAQDELIERAKREVQAERDRAVQELRREAVDLSLAAASKLMEERLDNEANRKLVTEYLGSLGGKH